MGPIDTAFWAIGCLAFVIQLAVFLQCILVASAVGVVVSPIMRIIRRKTDTNWIAAQTMRVLSEHLLGITVDIEDADNLLRAKTTPCVIVANHQSLLDAVWLSWVLPRSAVVVANEFMAKLPVLGWFMQLGGNMFVQQGDRHSVKALFEDSLHYLEQDKTSVIMFPEGKRNPTETGTLLEFKKGAFYLAYCTHAPIIPIAVQCTHSLYSRTNFRFRRNCIIRIRILSPISTENLAEEDIPALIKRTRTDIQKASISLLAHPSSLHKA